MAHTPDPRVYTDELLEGALQARPGQRVLLLGVDAPVVLAAARGVGPSGRVVAIEPWLPTWRRLTMEIEQAKAQVIDARFAATLDAIGEEQFDICAVDIGTFPSSRALLAMIVVAARRLIPDGAFYAAGPRNQGIISLGKRLETLFGNAVPQAYRKGQRVIASRRVGPLTEPDLTEYFADYTATLRGQTFRLRRDPAVFARGDVDPATAMLIDAMEVRPDDHVLDPGCGAGILGLVAARLAPEGHVVMTDADAASLALAQRNVTTNDLPNIQIVAADVVDSVAEQRYSLVICNPPFHERHEQIAGLADRFVIAAYEALEPGGRLYFVANRFLAYEPRISKVFGQVAEVAGDTRYKVLFAVKQIPAEPVPPPSTAKSGARLR